jgi:hypothetical protein
MGSSGASCEQYGWCYFSLRITEVLLAPDASFYVGNTVGVSTNIRNPCVYSPIRQGDEVEVAGAGGNGGIDAYTCEDGDYVRKMGPVGLPDLTFQQVGFDRPEPLKDGDPVQFGATIVNLGDGDAYNFRVEVYLDGSLFDSGTISLSAGESEPAWTDNSWTATEGTHTVTWIADTTNVVAESNENNNQMSRTFTVGPPPFDFSISAVPTSLTVKQGQTATFTVTVTSQSSVAQTVSLSLAGYHSTMSYDFSPSLGSPTFTASLRILTSTSTPAQSYALTISGRDGGKTHSTTVTLIVQEFTQDVSIAGGGRPEYQGARPVFFRGSNVRVSVSVTGEPVAYTLEIAESEDALKAGDYTGPWTEISSITTSERSFDFPIPNSAEIGAYQISSRWGKSGVFYVIFDPGLEHDLPAKLWSETRVNIPLSPVGGINGVGQTRHFDSRVLEWALFLAYKAKSQEDAVKYINVRVTIGVGTERPGGLPKLTFPRDIYDDIISKWGEPGRFPASPVDGDCKWIAATEVALSRSIGIPSTIVGGDWIGGEGSNLIGGHAWVEDFVYVGHWNLIVSDASFTGAVVAGLPGDARNSLSEIILETLGSQSRWILVCNADDLSLSRDNVWGPYTYLMQQGYDHGAFGSTVSLEETGHKLYLHVYDSEGRHVGLDYETKTLEVNIPGAAYYDSDTTTIVFLPLETTAFRYVVDAKYATSETENYSVTLSGLREGLVASEITQQGTIRQEEKQGHEVEVAGDGKDIRLDRPWWDRYQPWLMYSAIALIAGGLLAAHAIRRRTTFSRQAGPRVKEIRSTAGGPRVKSIHETGTKPRVLKVEEE